MPRTFLVLSLGMDSNSIFSGFAKKRQQAFLAPLPGKAIENAKASSIRINIEQNKCRWDVFQESYTDEMLAYKISFEENTYMSQTASHSLWDLGNP